MHSKESESEVNEWYCRPRDQTQWWHYNGHIGSNLAEHRFGFQLTFFRRFIDRNDSTKVPFRWPGCRTLFFAHFAVSDFHKKTFHYAHRRTIRNGGASDRQYHVFVQNWSAEEVDGIHYLRASMRDAAIDLELQPRKPAILNGRNGKFYRSTNQHALHLSVPRMSTKGKITVGGNSYIVDGVAWLDRESGRCDFGPNMAGWDWFGIQLDDQRELMVYQVCDENRNYNGHRMLSIVEPDGRTRQFNGDQFHLYVDATWCSPLTKTEYPIGWNLRCPCEELQLQIRPAFAAQELDTRGSTNLVYWEGGAKVEGEIARTKVRGTAYAELVGYHRGDRRIMEPIVGWLELLKNELNYWRNGKGRVRNE